MNSDKMFLHHAMQAKNKLYRFAYRLLGDADEAKDVVQDTFVKALTYKTRWNEIENWDAWFMQITKNLSLDKLRYRKKWNTTDFSLAKNIPTSHSEHADEKENWQLVETIITTLPDKQKQVIHLREVEGYSYQEIADILETDLNQVKVLLFRARQQVRESLQNMHHYGLS